MDQLITDSFRAHSDFRKVKCANAPGSWPRGPAVGPGSCHLPPLPPADSTAVPSPSPPPPVGLHQHVRGPLPSLEELMSKH